MLLFKITYWATFKRKFTSVTFPFDNLHVVSGIYFPPDEYAILRLIMKIVIYNSELFLHACLYFMGHYLNRSASIMIFQDKNYRNKIMTLSVKVSLMFDGKIFLTLSQSDWNIDHNLAALTVLWLILRSNIFRCLSVYDTCRKIIFRVE